MGDLETRFRCAEIPPGRLAERIESEGRHERGPDELGRERGWAREMAYHSRIWLFAVAEPLILSR
jgi:hypothetical protein